jgi:acyl carrier protein
LEHVANSRKSIAFELDCETAIASSGGLKYHLASDGLPDSLGPGSRSCAMNRDEIRNTLKKILENEIGEVVPELPDDAKIIEQFGLDSVDVVSLVMHVERQFRVRVAHSELENVDSVGALLDMIQSKTAAAAGNVPPQAAA